MDLEGNERKVFIFERKLDQECHTYGWGRGLRCAANLYRDNLSLEEDNEILHNKLDKYKKEIERLQSIISKGVDEMSENLLSVSMSTVTSNDILEK
jgi:hypothetical protein|tara:strand:+ start:2275 stop:2562 length:288 start_codon:yes stop_codon:yes gene_type:complete